MYQNNQNQYGQNQYNQQQQPTEAFDWNATIVEDAEEFELLQPGEYMFQVKSFEREWFKGSEKMSACNMAVLTLEVISPKSGKRISIKHNLMLHKKSEWSLSSFFAAIGQKKKGQPLIMNWNHVPGSTGRCEVSNREYKGNTYNEIKRFISAEQPTQFTPGTF